MSTPQEPAPGSGESAPPSPGGAFEFQAKAPPLPAPLPRPLEPAVDENIQAKVAPPSGQAPAKLEPKPLSPEQFAQFTQRADRVLAGFLVLFVFFLASFAATNSDVLMHLATGRLLVQGEYQFGVDPFAYTTTEATWINHNWLLDGILYLLYLAVGGPGLVILKALLVVGLAILLCRMSYLPAPVEGEKNLGTWWTPLVCTGLAMLAMSPRLFLQPAVVSLLFLGITLFLLMKEPTPSNASPSYRYLWFVPLLFVAWVNMDAWFILGPLTVALYLVGLGIQRVVRGDNSQGKARMVALVLGVGLVACFLNPHHVHALVLPPELAYLALQLGDWWPHSLVAPGKTLEAIKMFEPQLGLSPFSMGTNIAGWSYFVLLLTSLISFLFQWLANQRRVPWSWVPLYLFFLMLSLFQARLVPWFAVVAGPVTALNFQEVWRQRFGILPRLDHGLPRWSRSGRLATGVLLLLLLFLAWPGWLHSRPGDGRSARRVAWRLDLDPSLQQAALFLKDHSGDRVFNLSPELANYCAWFSSDVKCFFDYRFGLFSTQADTYTKVRLALQTEMNNYLQKPDNPQPGPIDWRQVFQNSGITMLALGNFQRDPNAQKLVGILWVQPERWTQVYGDGRTLIFGWKEAVAKLRLFPESRQLLVERAFGKVPPEQRTPENGVQPPLQEIDFGTKYLLGQSPTPLTTQEAQQHFMFYRFTREKWQWNLHFFSYLDADKKTRSSMGPWLIAWEISGLPVGSLSGPFPLLVHAAQPVHIFAKSYPRSGRPVLHALDGGPPEALVLAMRSARRGVAANSLDPLSHLLLANICQELWKSQEEYWADYAGHFSTYLRPSLRQIQYIAALKNYLTLDPNDPNVHLELAQYYNNQLNFRDVAVAHLRAACQNLDRLPPLLGRPQDVQERQRRLQADLKNLEDDLQKRQDHFDLKSVRLGPVQKFQVALQGTYNLPNKQAGDPRLGLALKALEILQDALQEAKFKQLKDEEKFQVINGQVQLLLLLGRVREVSLIVPELPKILGPASLQYEAGLAAATGNYAQLDKTLEKMEKDFGLEPQTQVYQTQTGVLTARMLGETAILSRAGQAWTLNWLSLQGRQALQLTQTRVAELRTLRGIMALEQGDTAKAARYFQEALHLAGPNLAFLDRPIAERYLQLLGKK